LIIIRTNRDSPTFSYFPDPIISPRTRGSTPRVRQAAAASELSCQAHRERSLAVHRAAVEVAQRPARLRSSVRPLAPLPRVHLDVSGRLARLGWRLPCHRTASQTQALGTERSGAGRRLSRGGGGQCTVHAPTWRHPSCADDLGPCSASGRLPWSTSPAGRAPGQHRVRGEIMGSQKCRIVGKSQPVLTMINPIIFTRTRRLSVSVGTAQQQQQQQQPTVCY
jgi:hypothetical protein